MTVRALVLAALVLAACDPQGLGADVSDAVAECAPGPTAAHPATRCPDGACVRYEANVLGVEHCGWCGRHCGPLMFCATTGLDWFCSEVANPMDY